MPRRPTFVITGATDGIGRLAAIALARSGADLVLTARNPVKADQLRAEIAVAAPEAAVELHIVDLADLGAVARTGRTIAARHPQIDVLVNNAGLHAFQQRITPDGFAEMIAVNYFAPWLLTQTLRDRLGATAPSRVITTASQASRQSGGLTLSKDLTDTAPFSMCGSSRIYGRSKLLAILYSLELARQLQGRDVAVNCLCPGFNVTGLGRELSTAKPLARLLTGLGIGKPEKGAAIIVKLATDPRYQVQSGLYLGRNEQPLTPHPPGARRRGTPGAMDADRNAAHALPLTSDLL